MMASPNNKDSQHLMHRIPPGSEGAEIGVWAGSTARQFLNCGISRLELIDPYSVEPYKKSDEYKSYDDYLEKYSKILNIEKKDENFQKYYDEIYGQVKSTIGQDPRVTIHRMFSDEWFESKPEKVDWIYVDGDHGYQGCLRDLENSLKVVKVGGMIMGDDYYWPGASYGKKGVTNAVDRFCKRNMFTKERHGQTQYIIHV